jgi:hypothetical protein
MTLVRVISTRGIVDVEVPDPKVRQVLGLHMHRAVEALGDPDLDKLLAEFKGTTVTGLDPETGEPVWYELESDLETLQRWETEGDLDIDEFYPAP